MLLFIVGISFIWGGEKPVHSEMRILFSPHATSLKGHPAFTKYKAGSNRWLYVLLALDRFAI